MNKNYLLYLIQSKNPIIKNEIVSEYGKMNNNKWVWDYKKLEKTDYKKLVELYSVLCENEILIYNNVYFKYLNKTLRETNEECKNCKFNKCIDNFNKTRYCINSLECNRVFNDLYEREE